MFSANVFVAIPENVQVEVVQMDRAQVLELMEQLVQLI